MMNTIFSIPETTFPTTPNGAVLGRRDLEPLDPLPADAEEEEFVELWAADPGNQGA